MRLDEVVSQVIGFGSRIETPFGEITSLPCDMGRFGRGYYPIEEMISKLHCSLAQSQHSRNSYQGNMCANLYSTSMTNIFDFFHTSQKHHRLFLTCGSSMSASSLLKEKLLELYNPSDKQAVSTCKVRLYTTPQESFSTIYPWRFSADSEVERILEISDDQQVSPSLIAAIAKHNQRADIIHLLFLSSVSKYSGERMKNLTAMLDTVAGLKREFDQQTKIFTCLDITAILSKDKLNLRTDELYKDIDFFIFNCTTLLGANGAAGSTNILIAKASTGLLQHQPIIAEEIREDDLVRLYRLSLTLQLIDSIGVKSIAQTESENMKVFQQEISAANTELLQISPLRSIQVFGITQAAAVDGEVDSQQFINGENLNVNIYCPGSDLFDEKNKPYLHPSFVSSVLHDLFGIIASPLLHVFVSDSTKDFEEPEIVVESSKEASKTTTAPAMSLKREKTILMMDVPVQEMVSVIGGLGVSESIIGSVSLSISALHTVSEVKYIVESLKLICEKGDELVKFYDKKSFLVNGFGYDSYDFGLKKSPSTTTMGGILGANIFSTNVDQATREQHYSTQSAIAKTVLNHIPRYFSTLNAYSKDKTEQHRKKDLLSAALPSTLKSKPKKDTAIEGLSQISLLGQAFVVAASAIKNELALADERKEERKRKDIEDEIQRKLKAERDKQVPPPPPPPIPLLIEPVLPVRDIEKEMKEMETRMKEALQSQMMQQNMKHQNELLGVVQGFQKEMESKIKQISQPKDRIVFEDAAPSVMFKNVMDHQEKRYRHLRVIFNYYAEIYAKEKAKQRVEYIPGVNLLPPVVQESVINQSSYVSFCRDFHMFNEFLDESVACQVYVRSLQSMAMNATKLSSGKLPPVAASSTKEMHFTEFLESLEKISSVFFHNNHLLITNFDKMEAMFQFMNIGDLTVIKKKLVEAEYLAAATATASTNQSGSAAILKQKNKLMSGSIVNQSSFSTDRKKTSSSSLMIGKSLIEWGEATSSVYEQRSSLGERMMNRSKPFMFGLDQSEISSIVPSSDQMSHGSYSRQGNGQSRGGGGAISISAASASGMKQMSGFRQTKNQSHSPQMRGYFDPYQKMQAGDPNNHVQARIREIEQMETRKQQELLSFLQSSQKNKRMAALSKIVK